MAYATLTKSDLRRAALRTASAVNFQDAIRSIALEEIDGQDVEKRSQWLANRSGVAVSTIQVQVAEMVDILVH